jgi:DNA-binding NtrC family response regulator
MSTILIADDEKNIRGALARSLRLEGYAALEAENGADALAQIETGDVDLVILDLNMPQLDGLALLEKMQERGLAIPSLVLTAHGSIEKAVRAIRLGAFDFIEKPPGAERILLAVQNALRMGRLEEENKRLSEEAGLGAELLGSSAPMKALASTVQRVAPTDASVLVVGENGTGKELVARAIHAASPRRQRAMVTVNCAAIPETLLESELFGHARGSFTGATEARRGKFQLASGGTLFLDEVGEVPLPLQPKMLRALESGEVQRVGGQAAEQVDVRVIAATNRDLESEVRLGRFRDDLYYRLLVVPVRVPALRERGEDILFLARHFLELACRRNRIRPKRLSEDALGALRRHSWPGNVRELRNAMGRMAILLPDETVRAEHLEFLSAMTAASVGPAHPSSGLAASLSSGLAASLSSGAAPESASAPSVSVPAPAETGLAGALERYERSLVLAALERNRWQMSRTAQELGLERSHLYKKLKALGIERPAEE